MWVIYAFGSAFFAGMTSILVKCGLKKTNSTVATAIRTIIVLIMSFFMAVGDCNERVLALLFPRDPARRREQGCAHRQIEHDIDNTSGVYLVERARFVAAKCMRLYDCRGHVYDD